jgi:hypothetical protein
MATARSLIDDARRRLVDPTGNRWGDDEMLDYLNYSINQYARRSKSFRRLLHLETGQFPQRFELPSDTVEVYIVEYDNVVMDPSSWQELSSEDDKFSTRTGAPERWYQDLTDISEMRLYPIPTDNDEDRAAFHDMEDTYTITEVGGVCTLEVDGSLATIYEEEFGVVVGIEDEEETREWEFVADDADTPVFNQSNSLNDENINRGALVAVAASKVRIGYTYIPAALGDIGSDVVIPDHLEEGLVFALLARAYEKDGVTQDLKKAQYWDQKFDLVTAEALRRATEGFMPRARTTEGLWL